MDKKQEILMAAFDIFCEKGYHLSVAELAGAVKIKTPRFTVILRARMKSLSWLFGMKSKDTMPIYMNGC